MEKDDTEQFRLACEDAMDAMEKKTVPIQMEDIRNKWCLRNFRY